MDRELFDIVDRLDNDQGDLSDIDSLLNGNPAPVFSALTIGRDGQRQGVLHLACRKGFVDIVKRLVGANASVELVDDEGSTPLHWLVSNPGPRTVEVMVCLFSGLRNHSAKEYINLQDKSKRTALHLFAYRGAWSVCKYLLFRGADAALEDRIGNTPAALALTRAHHSDEEVDLETQRAWERSEIEVTRYRTGAMNAVKNLNILSEETFLYSNKSQTARELIRACPANLIQKLPSNLREDGLPLIHIAAMSNKGNDLEWLLSPRRHNPKYDDAWDRQWECLGAQDEEKYLTALEAGLNMRDERNRTAIDIACKYDASDAISALGLMDMLRAQLHNRRDRSSSCNIGDIDIMNFSPNTATYASSRDHFDTTYLSAKFSSRTTIERMLSRNTTSSSWWLFIHGNSVSFLRRFLRTTLTIRFSCSGYL